MRRRLAPVLAAFLFLLPLMWAASEEVRTASVLVYLFGAWALLTALTAYLSRRLDKMPRNKWQERP